MADVLWSLWVGACSAIGFVGVTFALIRVGNGWPPVFVFAGSIFASEVIAVVVGKSLIDGFCFWAASAAVGAIGMGNFFLFGAIYKSISLRLLVQLAGQPGDGLEKHLLIDRVVRPSIDQRIDLLVEMGMVAEEGNARFVPTPKGRRFVARLGTLQRLFGVSSSGLYRSGV